MGKLHFTLLKFHFICNLTHSLIISIFSYGNNGKYLIAPIFVFFYIYIYKILGVAVVPFGHFGVGQAHPLAVWVARHPQSGCLGVAKSTPKWPRGWLGHPQMAGLGVASHSHGPWGWPTTPKGPNRGGRNHPQPFEPPPNGRNGIGRSQP